MVKCMVSTSGFIPSHPAILLFFMDDVAFDISCCLKGAFILHGSTGAN